VGNKAFADHVDSVLGHLFLGKLVLFSKRKNIKTQNKSYQY
jgi:hypothetical protein